LLKLNLHNFVSFYDYNKTPCSFNDNHKECQKLKNNLGYIHKREIPKLIKVPNYKVLDKKYREKYYHQVLMLFKPWTNEEELLNNFSSYEESYKFEIDNGGLDKSLVSNFELQKQTIEKAKNQMIELEKIRINNEELDTNPTANVHEIPNDIFYEQPSIKIDQTKLAENIKKLNKEQKNLFDKIIIRIEHQMLHKTNQCDCKKNQQIRIFCSGVAGEFNLDF
jgi:hypothetical protein